MEAIDVLKPMHSCPDVLDCLLEDHESLREVLVRLSSTELEIGRKRAIFKRFLPLYESHTHAEEQSIMEEGIQTDSLRPLVLQSLEEHEVTDLLVERMRVAVDNEQWAARLGVFCTSLQHHLDREAEVVFPAMREGFSAETREQLGRRYLTFRNRHRVLPALEIVTDAKALVLDQTGKVGYLLAWLMGVPAWILLIVFLIRG